MNDLVSKYKNELNILKNQYRVNDCDERIALDIEIAIRTIEKYTFDKYDQDKHFNAMIELVVNKSKKGNDGLTKAARGMLMPKMRVV